MIYALATIYGLYAGSATAGYAISQRKRFKRHCGRNWLKWIGVGLVALFIGFVLAPIAGIIMAGFVVGATDDKP